MSKRMFKKIRFRSKEYILGGETDGFIATLDDYIHGRCSYAHLHPGGNISRYGVLIGTLADIEFIGEVEEPEIADDAWENLGKQEHGW